MRTNCIKLTIVMLFVVLTTTAQQGINYKAIIHDVNGDALANTLVTVQFTILENGTTSVFKESHMPTTDVNGIIIVNIGEGTLISGDFNSIDWGSNPHFLKTEIDSGDGLKDLGTTEFKTVPYALFAKTVEDAAKKADVEALSADVNALIMRIQGLEDDLALSGNLYATDIDGNVYKTVKIGHQIWMAENLKVTHYADGVEIPLVTENELWANLNNDNEDRAYCYYNNNENEADVYGYGALYTWAAATNGIPDDGITKVQGVCPAGWHLPSDEEWKILEIFLGMDQLEANATGWRGTNQGCKLATDVTLWENGDLNSDWEFGSSGFSALPGGYRRSSDGEFHYDRWNGYWWSSTERASPSSDAYVRELYWDERRILRIMYPKSRGYSIRCLKD